MTSNQDSNPASFYASPQEARHARPEEFLYLACLHEGTGVDEPDFLAVVDAEEGRIVHETPMPNVGDELHHFGWNRCSSACHGPDRSHLIVPGYPLLADPHRERRRRPAPAADREGDRAARRSIEKTGYTRPHTSTACPATTSSSACSATPTATGSCGFAVLDARSFEVKGRWENGGREAEPQLRLLVPAAQERAGLVRVGRAKRLRARLRHRRRRRRPLRAAAPLLGSGRAAARADARPRRAGADPARAALAARPRGGTGLRRRDAGEHILRFHRATAATGPSR